MAETFFCPRGPGADSPFKPPFNGEATWRSKADGSRTCSYCGSLHPDDFLEIMKSFAAGVEGYSFGTTDKSYKAYGHRPGVKNASDGGIKFYVHHLPDAQRDEHMTAFRAACVRLSEAMQIRSDR